MKLVVVISLMLASVSMGMPQTTSNGENKDDPLGDLFGGLLGVLGGAVEVAQGVLEHPVVTGAVDTALEVGANATDAAFRLAGGVVEDAAEKGPEAVQGPATFLNGVLRAAGETKPAVEKVRKVQEKNSRNE